MDTTFCLGFFCDYRFLIGFLKRRSVSILSLLVKNCVKGAEEIIDAVRKIVIVNLFLLIEFYTDFD